MTLNRDAQCLFNQSYVQFLGGNISVIPLVPIFSTKNVHVWKSHASPLRPVPTPDQSPLEMVGFFPAGNCVDKSKQVDTSMDLGCLLVDV